MIRRASFALLLLAGWAIGCSTDEPNGLAVGCAVNSDCNSPLICAFGRCHAECNVSSDCPKGERCTSANGAGVCQLPDEAACSNAQACVTGLVCGPDEQCRKACSATVDCTVKEQRCVSQVCADIAELDDTGHLPGTFDAGSSVAEAGKDAAVSDATSGPVLGTRHQAVTSGGGVGQSARYRVNMSIGAPAPYGVGTSAGHKVTLGRP